MKIESKFKKGDFVWVLYRENNKWEIIGLNIDFIHIDEILTYGVYDIDIDDNIPCQWEEKDCFLTKEEAEEEKNKRNWEEEYDKMTDECIKQALEKFEKEWENEE